MTIDWKKIKDLAIRLEDLTAVGVANLISSLGLIVFWFYIATFLDPADYGQISYLISIGSVIYMVSLLGTTLEIIVYTSKEEKIQSAIHLLAIISGSIASIVAYLIFQNIVISIFIIGSVIFGLATAELLGRKLYRDFAKITIIQRILQIGFSFGFYYLFSV